MSAFQFYEVDLLLSSFTLLCVISPVKRKWINHIPFSCLAYCCIQKQRIYPAFSFLQPKQRLSQTRKQKLSMSWNNVTNCAIPRLFKGVSAAQSRFEMTRFLQSLKIRKKNKKNSAFFPVPYKDFIK